MIHCVYKLPSRKRFMMGGRRTNSMPVYNCVNHCLSSQGQWQAVPILQQCPAMPGHGQGYAYGQWQPVTSSEPCSFISNQMSRPWDGVPTSSEQFPSNYRGDGQPYCPQGEIYSCRKICCRVANPPIATAPSTKTQPELRTEFAQTDITYDPNMTTTDQAIQFPANHKLREVNIKETEVELREIRHRTGEREYEVVQRIANTKIPEDGTEPVTEYDELVQKRTAEEIDLIKAQKLKSAKSLDSMASSEGSSTHHVVIPDNLEINYEIDEEDTSQIEAKKISVTRIGLKKDKDHDDENATVIKKYQRVNEKDIDVLVDPRVSKSSSIKQDDDTKSISSTIRNQSPPVMRRASVHDRVSIDEDKDIKSMSSMILNPSPSVIRRASVPSVRDTVSINEDDDIRSMSSTMPNPRPPVMRRAPIRDTSKRSKREQDIFHGQDMGRPGEKYPMAKKMRDIAMSSVGRAMPKPKKLVDNSANNPKRTSSKPKSVIGSSKVKGRLLPKPKGAKKDDLVFAVVSSMPVTDDEPEEKIVNDARTPEIVNEDEEDEEKPQTSYRSVSQIVRDYSDDDFYEHDTEHPDNVSAMLIRRHYTKETETKKPGDLSSQRNIVSEKTAVQKHFKSEPKSEPETELEPEPEPEPVRKPETKPKRRIRQPIKKPPTTTNRKYPSNDIVSRRKVPPCRPHCYMASPCTYPCHSRPPCNYPYSSSHCTYPCGEVPLYPRYGFGGQCIYQPYHP